MFYRASTAAEAKRLGLAGWARNLHDGRVEVVAAGDDTRLAELTEWLWQGPPAAIVDEVTTEEWTAPVDTTRFDIR